MAAGCVVPYVSGSSSNTAANTTGIAALLSTGAGIFDILNFAANASAVNASTNAASSEYAPIVQEIRRRALQTNGFPFVALAVLFLFVVVLRVVWQSLATLCPCLGSLACFAVGVNFEGVPSFEDAYLEDRLRGLTSYEMRDMPMYKDFFF